MTIYVYAYDVYGARTYFTVSKVPKYAQQDRRMLENYLSELARHKLGVARKDVRLGDYSTEKFDQSHLPHYMYKKGHWKSHTTND
jgi:hypothetical protein